MSRNALIVGIDQYEGDPLAYCVSDAQAIRDVLELSEYGFSCKLLADAEASTRRIRTEFERVLTDSTEVAVFYFAGHGAATDFGTFLVTPDCRDRVDDGVDLDLLTRMIRAFTPSTSAVVVILDCCHSGAFQIGTQSNYVAMRADDLTQYVSKLSGRRVLIAACMENQLADEDDKLKHGVFTHYLIEAMTGEAADRSGSVTTNSIYDYVSRAFENRNAQRPTYRGDLEGRVVLGTGLSTKVEKDQYYELEEIERLATEHLQSLQAMMAKSVGDRQEWRTHAYRDVCKLATPICQWFERRRLEYPELARRPGFCSAETELLAKIRSLSNVEPGMHCEAGVVCSELGAGSFGTVWKVESESKFLAVKVYHGFDLAIEDKVSRFRHGFSAMRRLEHPLIVRVHSLYECPLSFSMDYIDGANFRDWVGTLDDPRDVVTLLLRITDTIQHAHNRGVVHRDIKPENIIMRHRETDGLWDPYLTDFDLSWFSTASLQTKDALGTVFYAAPEQLGKPGSASARSPLVDVFSMGQIMFYALTGSDPTPLDLADNVRGLQSRLSSWGIANPADLMLSLYSDCTSRKPNLRPQSMSEVSERLYAVSSAFHTYDNKPLTHSEFVREVIFAVVGLGGPTESSEFRSPAGQTSIVIHMGEDYCTLHFALRRQPLIDNVPDFKKGRSILNQRVDTALNGFKGARRRSGTGGSYEINVDVPRKSLTPKYVATVRSVITETLGALEKG